MKIKIKPLSLNHAYRGKRFKTPELEAFKKELFYLLPKNIKIYKKLRVKYVFGVSSKNADGDNMIKVFQDSLSEKYGFNDKIIYKWDIKKVDTKKGEEFIDFEINDYDTTST